MNQETVLGLMEPKVSYTKLGLTQHIHNDKTITSYDTRYLAICKIIQRLCKYKLVVREYKLKEPFKNKKPFFNGSTYEF